LKLKVKVQYLGLVKTYTNKGTDEFELQEGAPLSALLTKIAANSGKQFDQDIYEPGQKDVKAMFTVMVNGIVSGQLKGLETPLKNGDNVILMPLMTGG
jgi:molybdopterin converting factor small subunit